jgi:glycosyltransferase involved in cell wall biosynthesis
MTEEQFGWRVSENCPNALKVLDTEDLHFLRIARQQAVKEKREFKIEDLFSETAKREVAAILRCDSTLLVSEFEKELLEKQFKINPEILVYLPIFAENIPNVPSFEDRKDFVFIGNFLHEPNFDAVKYLKTEIWTKIKAKTTNVSLQIYGAYPTQKVFDLQNTTDRFLVNGRAEDALTVIQNARMMLAPLRFGAGIKGKLLEAMQCGTPSVTTSIGSESMCGDMPWNGFVSDDIDVFVEKAILLYNNKELWQQAQSNGYCIIENRYSRTQFVDLFFNHIYKVTENLQKFRNQNFIGQLLQHHHHASTKFMSKWIEEKNK